MKLYFSIFVVRKFNPIGLRNEFSDIGSRSFYLKNFFSMFWNPKLVLLWLYNLNELVKVEFRQINWKNKTSKVTWRRLDKSKPTKMVWMTSQFTSVTRHLSLWDHMYEFYEKYEKLHEDNIRNLYELYMIMVAFWGKLTLRVSSMLEATTPTKTKIIKTV